jgi:hypothetical protein
MLVLLISCEPKALEKADNASLSNRRAETKVASQASATQSYPSTADWVGHWESKTHDKDINIRLADDERSLFAEGYGTYGFDNPERVRLGSMSTGQFAAQGRSTGSLFEFSVGEEEDAEPGVIVKDSKIGDGKTLNYNIERNDLCKIRLRRSGVTLIAIDNQQCGGHNFSFTDTYFLASDKVWWWNVTEPIDGFYSHD